MNLFERLRYAFASKESQARIVTSYNQIGKPQHTPANYESFARRGYSKNAVVYVAISKIATACAGIKWNLYSKKGRGKDTEILDSPLLTLWDKPNPMQGQSSFIESVVAYRLISGNSYIESNAPFAGKPPLELWPARPDKMKIVPGPNGYVGRYDFTSSGMTRSWEVDPIKLTSQIMHWKTFNPLNDWYGLSPIEAAMIALDQNNAGQSWNLALLQNQATPSGVLQMKVTDSNPRGELTSEQYVRLKTEFDENQMGARNAGRPLIIEGGLSWTQTSMSPKDMEFVQSKNVSASDLALVFGVPGEIIGLGTKTFANYKEARLSFYEETILPTMDSLRDSLNCWLVPAFGENLWLDYDKDDIEALVEKRESKYTSLGTVNFLTQNEKRMAAGYDEVKGWNVFVIGNQILESPDEFSGDEEDGTDNTEQDPNPEPEADETDKPKPEIEDETDEEDSTDPDDDDIEDEKGWKSFNLLNRREKRQSWKRQNRRRKRLESVFERDVKEDFKEMTELLVKAAKDFEDRNLQTSDSKLIEFALQKIANDFKPTLLKTLKKHTRYTLEDFGSMVLNEGKSLGFDKEHKANLKYDSYVEAYVDRRGATQISTITNTNEKLIRRVVNGWVKESIAGDTSAHELSSMLEEKFTELTPGSARRIARTEVAMASTNGSLEAVKSLQIPSMYKEWVTASDDRVRDGHDGGADHSFMNGIEVLIDDKFTVPPDASMDGPGDSSATADQVINCRCVLTYKSKNQGEL